MTIEFEGEFYQYFKEEYGSLPRRFVYYLRKIRLGAWSWLSTIIQSRVAAKECSHGRRPWS
jgi:hypothetical protein